MEDAKVFTVGRGSRLSIYVLINFIFLLCTMEFLRPSSILAQSYDFNDGTTQNWTGPHINYGNENWNGLSFVFDDYFNYPDNNLGPLDNHGSISIQTLQPINNSPSYIEVEFRSPDLTYNPEWQNAIGWTAQVMFTGDLQPADMLPAVYVKFTDGYERVHQEVLGDYPGSGWHEITVNFPEDMADFRWFCLRFHYPGGLQDTDGINNIYGGIFLDNVQPIPSPDPLPLSAPRLRSPANNSTNISVAPTLVWYPVDGADSYLVKVYKISQRRGYFLRILVFNEIVTTTSAQIIEPLQSNTKYSWSVTAQSNDRGNATSVPWSFTTKYITLNFPNGGETLYIGDPYTIEWETGQSVGTVRIELSTNNLSSWVTIASNTANDGAFPFRPTWRNYGTDCYIRITLLDNSPIIDQSDKSFAIKFKFRFGLYKADSSQSNEFGDSPYLKGVPKEFALEQNHPNPFNPETNIKFQIPKQSFVVLKVYNMLGQEIRTLINDHKPEGFYSVRWDGRNEVGFKVPSGVYIYRLQAGKSVACKRMTLMK